MSEESNKMSPLQEKFRPLLVKVEEKIGENRGYNWDNVAEIITNGENSRPQHALISEQSKINWLIRMDQVKNADQLYSENGFQNERYQIWDFVYFYGQWKSLIVKNIKTSKYREFQHELIHSSIHIYKDSSNMDNIWCKETELWWKCFLKFWDEPNIVIIDCNKWELVEAESVWIHRSEESYYYIPHRSKLEKIKRFFKDPEYIQLIEK